MTCCRNLPYRELRQEHLAPVSAVRVGQAPLRPRRVPSTPPHLRPAVQGLAPPGERPARRGRGVPGRDPGDGRRRRVHHQRRRAVVVSRTCTARPASTSSLKPRPATRKLHSLPHHPGARGENWIEINVTKKDALGVRIDQSGKFSAMTLLRAMDPAYSTDADIHKAFYPTEDVRLTAGATCAPARRRRRASATSSTRRPARSTSRAKPCVDRRKRPTRSMPARRQGSDDPRQDEGSSSSSTRCTRTRRRATRKRCSSRSTSDSGRSNPPRAGKGARELFREKFQDPNRYRLGKGRPLPHQPEVRSGHPGIGNDALRAARLSSTPSATSFSLQRQRPDRRVDDIGHLENRQRPHDRRAGRR